MSFEEQDRQRARRTERKQDWILLRMAAAEKRWADGEARRVREFEALEGREMTRQEKIDASFDGLLRKMDVMTLEHLRILHDLGSDMQAARAKQEEASDEARDEARAEARAGREALLRMLDRLPPPHEPPPAPG